MIYLTRIEVRYRARNVGSCAVCGERVTIKDQRRGRPVEFRLANAQVSSKWIPVHAGCLHVGEDRPVYVGAPDFATGLLGGLLGTVLGNVLTGDRARSSFRDRRGNGVPLRRQGSTTAPTSAPRLPSPNAPIDAEFEEK